MTKRNKGNGSKKKSERERKTRARKAREAFARCFCDAVNRHAPKWILYLGVHDSVGRGPDCILQTTTKTISLRLTPDVHAALRRERRPLGKREIYICTRYGPASHRTLARFFQKAAKFARY